MTVQQISINIPERVLLAEKTDAVSFARELRMLAAVKLYESGRLSSDWAARLAGVPRVEFLLSLERYKVFPLAAESRDLERARGWSSTGRHDRWRSPAARHGCREPILQEIRCQGRRLVESALIDRIKHPILSSRGGRQPHLATLSSGAGKPVEPVY